MFENDDEFDEDAVIVHAYAHVIFSTAKQRPLLSPALQKEMWDCLAQVAIGNNMEALCVGGTENHVHILTSIDINLSFDELLELYKSRSAAWANEEIFPAGDFAWQENCAGFTVSPEDIGRVSRFIRRQDRFHARLTFQQEFLNFLERYEIDYDPKDVFD